MKRNLFILSLLCALLLCFTPALADGDFYVVAVGGGVGTRISSLPFTINQPGFYYLSKSLTGAGVGITVNCNNVTIDLIGFSISCTGPQLGSGIYLSGDLNNVEIRNGTISGFVDGIAGGYVGTKAIRIINVRATFNGNGISLNGSGHMVKGCTFLSNTYGLLFQVPGQLVKGCTFYSNGAGIQCSSSLLIQNVAYSNDYNIVGTNNTLVDNRGF